MVSNSEAEQSIPGALGARKRPTGLKVLIAANAIAAVALLAMFPFYSGGRGLMYLITGIVHTGLAFGLARDYGWARITTIAYALFQIAGLGSWSLIGLMTLIAEPLSTDKAWFLGFSAVAVPFLLWTVIYLLRAINPPSSSA